LTNVSVIVLNLSGITVDKVYIHPYLGVTMKLLLTITIAILPTILFAEMNCSPIAGGESGIQACTQQQSQSDGSCPCKDAKKSAVLESQGVNCSTPLRCEDNDLFADGKKKSRKELSEIRKNMTKMCKKKAKEYKKALFKHLLKQFKLAQAFQALLKKKKYKAKFNNGRPVESSTELGPNDIAKMTPAQLNQYMINKLEEKFPGLSAMAKKAKGKPEYKYGFHESETIPINVVIQKKGKKACVVNLEEAPDRAKFTPQECEFCEPKDIKESFVDDCAYMTSSTYPEQKAHQLLGINSKKKSRYCQPNMEGHESDMSEIDKMAKRLCGIAQDGLTPDFTIETSRNLYNDKTVNLAQKRGEFIQKYLYDDLKKNCKLDKGPSWIKEESAFRKQIKIRHPEYVGNKTPGNYGPNPYADKKQQANEIANLKKTLELESKGIDDKISIVDAEIERLQGEKGNIEKAAKNHQTEYEKAKKELEAMTDMTEVTSRYNHLEQIANSIQQLYNRLDLLEQRISDANSEKAGLLKQKANYTIDKITGKVGLLKEFYKEKNEGNPVFSKNKWDKKLFNDFKMVRITGKAVEESTLGTELAGISPELSIMLNTLVEMDTFTCVVEPISTKKRSLEGILKGAGKVAMGITLPIVGIGAGVGAVLASPFTTLASLLCFGCGKPGKVLPKWMTYGNLTTLDLSRPSRKAAWKATKKFVKSYVTLGGRLKVKSHKKRTLHDNMDELAKEYYGDDYKKKSKPPDK
jgi:uncharacterized small protein (DUF1192 family)